MNINNNINFIRSLYNQAIPKGNGEIPAGTAHESPSDMPEDRVTFSKEALTRNRGITYGGPTAISGQKETSPEEQQVVNDLKRRDAEVKSHEAAHMAAGSGLVHGGASYQYQSGPDGKMYAVGGEVQIDVSAESTPEATIQKMQQVRAAALAPAQPSGTDRAVAAQASQVEGQARMEKMQEDQEEQQTQGAASSPTAPYGPESSTDVNSRPGSRIDFMA